MSSRVSLAVPAALAVAVLVSLTLLAAPSPVEAQSLVDGGTTTVRSMTPVSNTTATRNAPAPSSPVTTTLTNTVHLPYVAMSAYLYLPMVSRPSPVRFPSPGDDATAQSVNAYLTWDLNAPALVNPTFTVYLEAGNPAPTAVLATGLTRPAVDPYTFALETTYYWQVMATGENGDTVTGPVWSFTTDGPFTPEDLETMVYVPGGEFQMGCDVGNPFGMSCDYDKYHYELPMHTVLLDAFYVDKYEVTVSQYRACVAAGGCQEPRRFRSRTHDSYYDNAEFDHFPVLYVSNWDARDYCAWAGKRLPTEAEWEKAARGAIDVRSWPWGNDAMSDCTRMNYDDPNIDDGTNQWCNDDVTRVGSYPTGASPYGAMDMGGNVFEWVTDLYDVGYYLYTPYYNPTGPTVSRHEWGVEFDETPYYSIRGGSYRPNWYYSTVSHRHWGHHGDPRGGDNWTEDRPYFRNDQVGFRCVKNEE